MGAHQLQGSEDTNHVGISKINIHPEFDQTLYDNDFAIVTLKEPVTFDEKIQQVCLPTNTERYLNGKSAKITGWGVQNLDLEDFKLATNLQAADVNIVSQERCRQSYGSVIMNDRKICAWDQGRADTCKGDSGSPLVFEENEQ